MAKIPIHPLDNSVLLNHVKNMARNWEKGHAVLVHMAKLLLMDCGSNLKVEPKKKRHPVPPEFDELEEVEQLARVQNWVTEAAEEFEHHYGVVFSALQQGRTKEQTEKLLPPLRGMVLWYFGALPFCANCGDSPVAQMISLFSTPIKESQRSQSFWDGQFIRPMKNNAREWRSRFRKIERRFAITPISRAYAQWIEATRNDPELKVVTFSQQYNKKQLSTRDHVTAHSLRAKIFREDEKMRKA